MSLIEQLKNDKIQAMIDREHLKKDILSVIIASAVSSSMADAKNPSKIPSDAVVLSTIEKQIKTNEEFVGHIKGDVSKIATASKLIGEIDIIKEYLPKKMSAEEIKSAISEIIQENSGNKSVGLIMKVLKEKFAGQYDGAAASGIAKEMCC